MPHKVLPETGHTAKLAIPLIEACFPSTAHRAACRVVRHVRTGGCSQRSDLSWVLNGMRPLAGVPEKPNHGVQAASDQTRGAADAVHAEEMVLSPQPLVVLPPPLGSQHGPRRVLYIWLGTATCSRHIGM